MQTNFLLKYLCIKLSIEHSSTCDSREHLNYTQCTEISGVNRYAFIHRLLHEDLSSIITTNTVRMHIVLNSLVSYIHCKQNSPYLNEFHMKGKSRVNVACYQESHA